MNIATIGTGFIVERFLLAAAEIPEVHVTALYSRSREKALPLSSKHEVPNIYTDLDSLLKDSSVDALYIASPNSLHYAQTKKALAAGKHVLCEKPFTSNAAEAEELIHYAEKQELILMEAITTIHLPNFLQISSHLHKISPVRLVKCNYSQYSSRYDKLLAGEVTNVFNPAFSGGALMDINVYNLHFLMRLFGAPHSVSYLANKQFNGIDTSGIVSLKYEEFTAECTGSKDTAGYNAAFIQGENGWMHVIDGVNGCARVEIHTGESVETINEHQHPNVMFSELEVFTSLVQGKKSSEAKELSQHSLQVMKVLDKARRSAEIIFPSDR